MSNVTEKEREIVLYISTVMDSYDDGFSDVMVEDLVRVTGSNLSTVRGLLGSLVKKDLVGYMDVNEEYNVYFLTLTGFDYLGYTPDYLM